MQPAKSTDKIVPPPHILGPLIGRHADMIRARQDRFAFVAKCAADGHGRAAVARALGVNMSGFARDYGSLFRAQKPEAEPPRPQPKSDRARVVIKSGGRHDGEIAATVSLPLAPWDAPIEIGADPRRETTPRGNHMVGERVVSPDTIEARLIAKIMEARR